MNHDKDVLVREMDYDCPLCDKVHKVQVKKRISNASLKNESIEYEQIYYYCPVCGEEFVPSKLMDENLLRVRDTYRRAKRLLTSDEIREIRRKFNLTQKEFSNLLGWGDVTIQRYESKLIQDETYDSMIRMVSDNPSFALNLLDKHKATFNEGKFNDIRETIKQRIREQGNLALKIQEIKNFYVDFEEESDLNGYKKLDTEKVSNLLGYFAQFIKPLSKVKMMKLLWYTDALHFKRYNRSMTGLVYKHFPLGVTPVAYNELLSLPSILVEEEYIHDLVAYHIKPKEHVNISSFTLEELEILQMVANFFKDKKTDSMLSYMPEEIVYGKVRNDDLIPYSLALKLRELK